MLLENNFNDTVFKIYITYNNFFTTANKFFLKNNFDIQIHIFRDRYFLLYNDRRRISLSCGTIFQQINQYSNLRKVFRSRDTYNLSVKNHV